MEGREVGVIEEGRRNDWGKEEREEMKDERIIHPLIYEHL